MPFDAIGALTELTGRLDAVRHVSAKLLKHDPDGASDELVTVLQEVSKTFLGFESVLVRYLSLRFTSSTRDQDQAELLKLEGPQVRQMAGEFRAHCRRIGVLYDSALRDWFEAAPISPQEKSALETLFSELEGSDAFVIVPAVDELATWLEKEVASTSELVNKGRFDDAGKRVLAARREVAPLRHTMGRIVGEFRDLEIQFTA
jgi:hypothetical protein